MKKTVIAGHICVDIFPQFEHAIDPVPGHLYEVGKSTFALGGAVSNTGLTMYKLGMPVSLMGTVGQDAYGEKALSLVGEHAPEHVSDLNADAAADTSYTLVFGIPGKDRIFFHCPGANAAYGMKDVNWDTVAAADLFHFGYPSFMANIYANDAAELLGMYAKAKSLGVTTAMDPGMPDPSGPAGRVDWKGVLARLLPTVDVYLPSADELLYMVSPEKFGKGDDLSPAELSELGDLLIGMGTAVAVIKLGGRGMYVRTAGAERIRKMGKGAPADVAAWADKELWFPVFTPDQFKGATGAGDASIGAFLASLLRGLSVHDAGTMACAVGACNVEAADSLSGIRSWDDTCKRIAANWRKAPLTVDAPGWKQLPDGVWEK